MAELEARDLIDCEADQELFWDLVTFNSPARMLIISDREERGKSSLLRRLKYSCRHKIKPPIPASFIDLGKIPPSSFGFVTQVMETMKDIPDPADPEGKREFTERFAKFNMLNDALRAADFSKFSQSYSERMTRMFAPTTVQGAATVGGNVAKSATVAGTIIENMNVQIQSAYLTDEQKAEAQEQCVDAFFEDLHAICETQPFVLMLDTWEMRNTALSDWYNDVLLAKHCFQQNKNQKQLKKLAIVVAGRSYDSARDVEKFGLRSDEFEQLFNGKDDYMENVKSLVPLNNDWDEVRARDFIIKNGFKHCTDADVKYVRDLIERHLSFVRIIAALRKVYSEGD